MASLTEKYIVGLFDDDAQLLKAVESIKAKGIKIDEVYTPFPVHGLEHALGYKDSRLPDVGFMFGLTGTIVALTMQIFIYTFDWQINIAGKSFFPLPSFIPITFELTVLFCALGMVGTYLYVSGLYPGKKAKLFDERQTDDRFVVTIKASTDNKVNEHAEAVMRSVGAIDVRYQEL
jgi:hypothetical protein